MKVSKKKAEAILKKIAEDNNTTVEDVKKEIGIAIQEGMKSDDPKAREHWEAMSKGGKEITPEMLISYLTDQVGKK